MPITPENVAGLVVGEGCFYAESAPDGKYSSGWRVRPAFCIEMRADEREVLEEVRRHLACGKIYDLDFGRYRGYRAKGWQPHVKFRVSRISDLDAKVIPFFEIHPLFGRKLQAFEIFRDLVVLIAQKRHAQPEGLQHARLLAEALAAHNRRGTN